MKEEDRKVCPECGGVKYVYSTKCKVCYMAGKKKCPEKEVLFDLYITKAWSISKIAREYHVDLRNVNTQLHKCGIEIRPNRGRFSHNWKGENCKGYRKLQGVSVHIKAMEDSLGRDLKEEEIVHHIDLDKLNNEIKNLYLCEDKRVHSNVHATINKLIKSLLERGIIEFKDGEYLLK